MSKDFLHFPDADILLFQENLKDSKLSLGLDLFDDPCSIESGICDDPFISYRDESLSSPSYCGTPESSLNLASTGTSPDRFRTTPSTPDSGSLSDIPSLDPIDEFADLKFTMPPSDKDSDYYEEDLDFRAPFISMNMDDDFPLISPSSCVMWGPQEPAPKKTSQDRSPDLEPQRISPSRQKNAVSETSLKSSLAALLQSEPVKKNHQGSNRSPPTRKDPAPNHKRWASADPPTRGGSKPRPRNHIIMLDNLPVKKTPPQKSQQQPPLSSSTSSQRRDRRSHSPPYGSHTTTVKVNDRLIKVQVSVSELSTSSIEHKQPFPSPPDPPPKRTSPSRPNESPKRLKVDSGIVCSAPQGIATDSVLLNLLISGEDASRGYLCSGNSRYTEAKFEPAMLSLPSSETSGKTSVGPSDSTELLASESELLDSFLKISQYDAEVNAPIQSSHLLQGDDLLSALDQQPLLRSVPALV